MSNYGNLYFENSQSNTNWQHIMALERLFYKNLEVRTLLLLCGKSCAGKDTIQKELIKIGMKSVVTYTTRPPRNRWHNLSFYF